MMNAEELRTLANTHEENGDYESALRLYRRALLIQEKSVGHDSPEMAPFIYDLAMINAAVDNDHEAENLFAWLLKVEPSDPSLADEVAMVRKEMQRVLPAA